MIRPYSWVLSAALVSLIGVTDNASAQANFRQQPPEEASAPAQSASWRFELTPYLWASGIKGQISAEGRTVQVDVGFSEILSDLDGAFALTGWARKGHWAGAFEIFYTSLSQHDATPGPAFTSATFGAKQLMLEGTVRYGIVVGTPVELDLFAGGRYWDIENTIGLTSGGTISPINLSGENQWTDPIVGMSGVWNSANWWLIQARGDVGGFGVGSELSWQLLGLAGVRFSESVALKAGYRHLDRDFAGERAAIDVALSGLIVGVTVVF